MTDDPQKRYQSLVSSLLQKVRAQPALALSELDNLLSSKPDPNLLHLKGMAHARLGQHQRAIDAMEASLRLYPPQPEAHNNLGNSFKALHKHDRAEAHYAQAINLNPAFPDALKNLGLLQLSEERYEEAEKHLQKALASAPGDVSALTALGNVHQKRLDYPAAIDCYKAALDRDPNYVNALHNLGLCYKLSEDPLTAIQYFQRASALAPEVSEIDVNWGNAQFELGNYGAAETLYRRAIAKSPDSVLAHETLAELLWQLGKEEVFTHSYVNALASQPQNMGLRLSLANLLVNSRRFEQADSFIRESLAIARTPQLLSTLGRLQASTHDYASAQDSFVASLALAPSMDVSHDLARVLIIEGDYQHAMHELEALQASEPHNQLTWALLGTCWRLIGDSRYRWLIDYDRDVSVLRLRTPDGYDSLEAFLQDLNDVLLGMHQTKAAPMRQTLVGGTQTPGRLLHKPDSVVQAYREVLTQAVAEFIDSMPDDPTHPLFSRKSRRFEFSGSWSVRLHGGGYHVNHVHPEGWISSACYVHLPDSMNSNSGAAGCIKFGETPLGLGEREVVERVVCPEPGQLALFPSYAWHGTYDFEAEEGDYRLTAPFDVVPLS